MGRGERGVVGFGWFWLGNYCFGNGVFYWCRVGVLFDYLYLFYSLYWWILVCFVGWWSGFRVVSIALFTWCFVMVCG